MNGHVFQCHDETTKTLQFTKTVRELNDHVNKTLKFCQDVASIFTRFELTPLTPPDDLTEEEAKSPVKRMLREAEVNLLEKRRHIVASNIRAIYDVAWGQCSPKMQAKLTAMNEYEEKRFAGDCIWLLKSINSISINSIWHEEETETENILTHGGGDVEVEVGDANVAMDKAKFRMVDETTTPTEEEDNDNVPHWSLQVFTNLEKEEADALKRAGDLNDPRNVFVSDIDGGAYTEDGVEGADDAIPLDDAEPEFDEDAEENYKNLVDDTDDYTNETHEEESEDLVDDTDEEGLEEFAEDDDEEPESNTESAYGLETVFEEPDEDVSVNEEHEEKQSEDRHLEQEAKRKCLEEDDYMVVIHERKSRVKGQMLEQADDYVIVNHERKSRVKGQMLEQADDYVEVNHEEEDILNNGGDDVEVEVGDANVAMDKAKSHTVDETTTPTEEEDNDNVPHWSLQVFTNPEKANHERKSRVKGQMLDFVGLTNRGSVFCCGSQMTSLPSSARSEELQDEGADDLNDLRKVSISGILNKGADDFNDHRTGANDLKDHRTVFDSGTFHDEAGDLNDPRNAFVPDIGNDSDEELHDEADQGAAVTTHQFLLEKLKRVLQYLNGTLDEFLMLGADDLSEMKTWVDASYAVHKDMKSHTGGVVSFGRGAVMSKSSKQKLNTKSSTEAELVGASDYLTYPIWAKNFLAAQGYELKENVFYQDNQSTIRFEKNGRKSCGPNSRHIDIRYFFIKDRLELGDIDVQYCPTAQMLADFFTKPLQGNLFRMFRAVIMGHKHISTLKEMMPSPPQERVGKGTKIDTMRNGDGERKTDVGFPQPIKQNKLTYAEVVRKRTQR